MKLHLDIDCTSLDDLKSAKATIDRLIQEHEVKTTTTDSKWRCPECGPVAFPFCTQSTRVYKCALCGSDLIKDDGGKPDTPVKPSSVEDEIGRIIEEASKRCRKQLDIGIKCIDELIKLTRQPNNMQYEPCGDEWKCSKCGEIMNSKAWNCTRCGGNR